MLACLDLGSRTLVARRARRRDSGSTSSAPARPRSRGASAPRSPIREKWEGVAWTERAGDADDRGGADLARLRARRGARRRRPRDRDRRGAGARGGDGGEPLIFHQGGAYPSGGRRVGAAMTGPMPATCAARSGARRAERARSEDDQRRDGHDPGLAADDRQRDRVAGARAGSESKSRPSSSRSAAPARARLGEQRDERRAARRRGSEGRSAASRPESSRIEPSAPAARPRPARRAARTRSRRSADGEARRPRPRRRRRGWSRGPRSRPRCGRSARPQPRGATQPQAVRGATGRIRPGSIENPHADAENHYVASSHKVGI